MRPEVHFQLSDGRAVTLGPGDLIGRTASAALVIDDPRVSEAHALVSLRRGELYLLALRRLIGVAGKPQSEVRLERGGVLELADGVALTVARVTTPPHVAAIRVPGLGTRALGQVNSFVVEPPLRVVTRFVPGAAAHVWSAGPDAWRLRIGNGAVRTLERDATFSVAGTEVTLCLVNLTATEHAPTLRGGLEARLRIVAHYDSVEIHRSEQPVLTIGGIGARLISELVTFGGPVGWETLARELWKDEADVNELRHRWDVALGRVRSRLREAGIRADLLRSDGGGQVQLVIADGDQVVDRT